MNVCVCGHDLWVLPQTFTLFINPPKMLAKFSYPKRPQNILSSPPHHLKSEYLPFLTWVVITVCVPETRSIGLKKTNSAGLFKAGLRQPRVSAKCEFTEFRNESLEIISV